MSRTTYFNSPLLLGFDHLERMLDRVSRTSAEGYPPYNIEQIGDNRIRISLAVAGFSMDDLQVTVEDNQLVVRGRNNDDESDRIFLHRGIAARQFQRSFVLADGIEITGASLEDGLLNIDIEQYIPEPEVKTIEITRGKQKRKKFPASPTKTIDVIPQQ